MNDPKKCYADLSSHCCCKCRMNIEVTNNGDFVGYICALQLYENVSTFHPRGVSIIETDIHSVACGNYEEFKNE